MPMTPSLSVHVSEFRGWFTNLFNQWKPQPLVLHSRENVIVTQSTIKSILEDFKVRVQQQDPQDLWSVLICKREKIGA